mmetsp:Transcript_64549/g.154206  ORF Transcript_64549/g.154206 Transcript_64549/m.154206 type:complete len:259 (+) Transcript_64549:1338-2114(+)
MPSSSCPSAFSTLAARAWVRRSSRSRCTRMPELFDMYLKKSDSTMSSLQSPATQPPWSGRRISLRRALRPCAITSFDCSRELLAMHRPPFRRMKTSWSSSSSQCCSYRTMTHLLSWCSSAWLTRLLLESTGSTCQRTSSSLCARTVSSSWKPFATGQRHFRESPASHPKTSFLISVCRKCCTADLVKLENVLYWQIYSLISKKPNKVVPLDRPSWVLSHTPLHLSLRKLTAVVSSHNKHQWCITLQIVSQSSCKMRAN